MKFLYIVMTEDIDVVNLIFGIVSRMLVTEKKDAVMLRQLDEANISWENLEKMVIVSDEENRHTLKFYDNLSTERQKQVTLIQFKCSKELRTLLNLDKHSKF